MAYPDISENKITVGAITYYYDPLHNQIVGLATTEVFRKTLAQIQTEIDTANEQIVIQDSAKDTAGAILAGME